MLKSVNPNVPDQTPPTTDNKQQENTIFKINIRWKNTNSQRRRNKTKYNKKASTRLQDMDVMYGGKITVEIIKEQDLPYV